MFLTRCQDCRSCPTNQQECEALAITVQSSAHQCWNTGLPPDSLSECRAGCRSFLENPRGACSSCDGNSIPCPGLHPSNAAGEMRPGLSGLSGLSGQSSRDQSRGRTRHRIGIGQASPFGDCVNRPATADDGEFVAHSHRSYRRPAAQSAPPEVVGYPSALTDRTQSAPSRRPFRALLNLGSAGIRRRGMSADDANVAPRASEERPGGRLLSHLGKAVEVITSGGASPSRRRTSSDSSTGGAGPSTSHSSSSKRRGPLIPPGGETLLSRLEEIPSPTRSMSRSVSFKLAAPTSSEVSSVGVGAGPAAAKKLDEHARRIQRLWRKKSKSKSLSPSSMANAERSEQDQEKVQRTAVRRPSIREFVFRSARQMQAATKIQSAWRQKSRSRGSLSSVDRSTQSNTEAAAASASVSPFFPGEDSVDTLTWGIPSLTPRRRRSWAAWSDRLGGSAANSRTTSPDKHGHDEAAISRLGGTAAAAAVAPAVATTSVDSDVAVLAPSAAPTAPSAAGGFWTDAQNWFGNTFGGAPAGQPGLLETWWKDRKRRAIKSLLHNSAPILKRTLGDIGDLLKENTTADPDMPEWLRPVLRNLVGSFWEDVETEVETGLKMFVVKPPEEPQDLRVTHDPKFAKSCLGRWGLKLRAFVLSHYLPHDRSIWGRLKDPWYLLMTATTMLPIFGCRVFFFGMILFFLLFPGPPDEYQLINFILIFKGTQFFTTGVILGYFGAMQYYMCYLFADNVRLCINEHGPGVSDYLASLLFDTFGSVILVWVAFLGLPKTKTHWHNKVCLHGEAPVEREEVYCWCLTGVVRKGGRIRFLMRWDLCCFVGCWVALAPFYFASSYHIMSEVPHHTKIVHAKQTIFWCRILYSLLSLPFVIFVIPGLGRVLTHSLITGFDSTGACREFAFPEPAGKDEV